MSVAIHDAFRYITTSGTAVGESDATIVSPGVNGTLNLSAGFGITLVADPVNKKITITNTGNGTGALTTITTQNAAGTYYPIFTRAASAGDFNALTGTYQMSTMYYETTTDPLTYNPGTGTLSTVNLNLGGTLTINGVTNTGTTGTGNLVFSTSPTFTTSIDGAATFTAFSSPTSLTIGGSATTVTEFANATSLSTGSTTTAAQIVNWFTSSTGSSTYNVATGATANGNTKAVNIGTGGVSGSTTNITIGSSAGSNSTTIYGLTAGSLPLASSSAFGAVKVDGTSITATAGVISVPGFQPNGVFNITSNNTTTVLTSATAENVTIIGSNTQTIQFPDATTLKNGWIFRINNNSSSSSSLTVNNNGSSTIGTIPQGGISQAILLDNTTTNGSWDFHGYTPTGVLFGSSTLQLGSASYTIGPFNTTLTLGTATGNTTYNFGTGATASSNTKAINIGTGGVSGSTTNIILGSSAGTNTTTIYGLTAGSIPAFYLGTTSITFNRASGNQSLTGISSVVFPGSVSGTSTLQPQATAGTTTFTLPTTTGTLVGTGDSATVTNTMLANTSVTFGSTSVALGATSTTLAGLTSIDGTTGLTSAFATPNGTVALLGAATTLNLANTATSLSIGNTATGAQTVNMFTASTAGGTYNFATGITTTGNTKTINIGTGGLGGSTTAITLGSTAGTSGVTVNGNLTVNSLFTVQQTVEKFTSPSISANAVTLDFTTGAIFALSSNSANITANFTNIPGTAGQVITTTLIITQGATAYIPSAITINGGGSVTPKWQNGSAPTGVPNHVDIVSFTFITTATNTWTTIGGMVDYN